MNGCVVVFGREPIAGRVKTRLAADLGAEAAARVYAVLLDHALEAAAGSGLRVLLSLAERPSAGWVRGLKLPLEVQRPGDLGERMADAFARRFVEGEERVVVVGSDCPTITSAHLRQAVSALDEADAVLGPAADGGYYLVAQPAPGADLFAGIPWSDPETLVATRDRLTALGAAWTELEELSDIDTESDLKGLLADPGTPRTLAHRLRAAVGSDSSPGGP